MKELFSKNVGCLTTKGQEHSYQAGKQFKDRYNHFLSQINLQNHSLIFSTNLIRTIKTISQFLKGIQNQKFELFNNSQGSLEYLKDFNFNRKIQEHDIILRTASSFTCKKVGKIRNEIIEDHVKNKTHFDKFMHLMPELSQINPNLKNKVDYREIYNLCFFIR